MATKAPKADRRKSRLGPHRPDPGELPAVLQERDSGQVVRTVHQVPDPFHPPELHGRAVPQAVGGAAQAEWGGAQAEGGTVRSQSVTIIDQTPRV